MGGEREQLTLDYGRARLVPNCTRALRTREFAGVLLAAGGFVLAWVFGREAPGVADGGVLVMLGGFLLYVLARIRQRTDMSRWAKAQLIGSTILSFAGVLSVMRVAVHATEGPAPDTLRYWLSSNQTYHADSRLAMRQGWITLLGVTWFALVLAAHRIRHRRDVARRNRAG